MSVPLPSLLIALTSTVVGALFVASDAALASLSSARVAALLEQDDLPNKNALERYHHDPWRMRSTFVVGRVLFAALTAILLAETIAHALPGWRGTVLAVIATVAIYAPTSDLATAIARRNPDVWGLRLATYLRPFELMFWPLAAPLARVSRSLAERVKDDDFSDPVVASAEVEYFVDEVERSGVVGAEPAEMIRNVLEFEDRRARDVMVPRGRVEAIELRTPLDEVRKLVADSGHSRYPVYDGQLDNVFGLLVAKDVFKAETGEEAALRAARDADATEGHDAGASAALARPRSLADVVRRDVIFVHEQQKLVTLLREMRQKRQHLAVVVDEFGGTSGIITLEDVIEEIVGDIRDEHDEAETAPIQELEEGRLLAIASLPLEDLFAYLGLPVADDDRQRLLGSAFDGDVSEGDQVSAWGLEVTVREARSGKPERVEVVRPPRSSLPAPARAISSRPPAGASKGAVDAGEADENAASS